MFRRNIEQLFFNLMSFNFYSSCFFKIIKKGFTWRSSRRRSSWIKTANGSKSRSTICCCNTRFYHTATRNISLFLIFVNLRFHCVKNYNLERLRSSLILNVVSRMLKCFCDLIHNLLIKGIKMLRVSSKTSGIMNGKKNEL